VNFWYLLDEKLSRLEQVLIAALLTVMILLAFAQIVLRNFFGTGIDWGDALVRYLVVWVGFIGAAVATREGKPIQAISHFVSAAVCGMLTWAGIKFIFFEAQMGGVAFFKLPVWVPELIIPITFGLMTLRYSLRLLDEIIAIITGTRPVEQLK
jgi:TRAP-type C4-dicarboxylate transport system permease small subunit